MKREKNLLLISLATTILITSASMAAFAAYPEKPIEFVVHQAPGGGSDLFARGIVDMLSREKIITVPMPVLNKAGGSGAVAVAYVGEKKADPYTILAVTTPVLSTMAKRNMRLDDFTPVCRLVIDPNVVCVKVDSPYKEITELIAAAKKARKSIKMGVGSIGGTDHQIGHMIGRAAGVEFNIIGFKTGGEAFTALLGGHVDFSTTNPSEMAGQLEAGKIRFLTTLTEKRLPYLPNVPTMKEKGIDLVFLQGRGFFLPKGAPVEVVKYFEAAFDKLSKTANWKKYVNENMLLEAYQNGSEYKAWLGSEMPLYTKNLKEMGLMEK